MKHYVIHTNVDHSSNACRKKIAENTRRKKIEHNHPHGQKIKGANIIEKVWSEIRRVSLCDKPELSQMMSEMFGKQMNPFIIIQRPKKWIHLSELIIVFI